MPAGQRGSMRHVSLQACSDALTQNLVVGDSNMARGSFHKILVCKATKLRQGVMTLCPNLQQSGKGLRAYLHVCAEL